MNWKQFKALVEENGVTDEMEIFSINMRKRITPTVFVRDSKFIIIAD